MSKKGSSSSSRERGVVNTPQVTSLAAPNGVVIVGTYHSIVAGLVLKNDKLLLKFSTKHHVGCVNHVAICDKYFASCGVDERLFLFTVKNKGANISDLGSVAPASEITCMEFPSPQYLICGAQDGSIGVYRSRDWECAAVIPVHVKRVTALAMHPTGNVCVSVGADRYIAVIDMTAGKLVTKIKIAKMTPHTVQFAPRGGKSFFVGTASDVIAFETLTAKQLFKFSIEVQPNKEIHTFALSPDGSSVFVGTEEGTILHGNLSTALAANATKKSASQPKRKSGVKRSRDEDPEKGIASEEDKEEEEVNTPPVYTFSDVKLTIPQNVLDANEARNQGMDVDERKKKYPVKHTTRIRSILSYGEHNLITSDTNGIVIVWRVLVTCGGSSRQSGDELELVYVCSANCSGRITSLAALER